MKNIFLVIGLTFMLTGCITMVATPEQEKTLKEIREFSGLSKSELYSRILIWIARTYNSANDVIQLKDPASGQIICKGIGFAYFELGVKRYWDYNLIINIEDSKISYQVESIISKDLPGLAGPDMAFSFYYIKKYHDKLKASLFDSISTNQ